MDRLRPRLAGALLASACVAFSLPATADEAVNLKVVAEKIVDDATQTLKNFSDDQKMTWFRDNVKSAKAVVVVPTLVKGGFVLGGSGGSGVVLVRDESTGAWRGPAFVTTGAISAGFQAGGTAAESVMMAMTDKGRDALLSNKFQIGTDVSIAAGPIGGGAAAATTDIVQFVRAIGLYGGFNVEGTVIAVRDSVNEAYYGVKTNPTDILIKGEPKNPHADALVKQLTGTATK